MKTSHCIILHGWLQDGDAMASFVPAIEAELSDEALERWKFWTPSYDWRKPFDEAADELLALFREREDAGEIFTNVVLIGYSMGGLVARRMLAQGFEARALLTLASPHGGVPPIAHMTALLGDDGAGSLSVWSSELADLNADPADIAQRHRMICHAVTYTDILGLHHPDDGLIEWAHQLLFGAFADTIHLQADFETMRLEEMVLIHATAVPHAEHAVPLVQRAARLLERFQGVQITWVRHDGAEFRSEGDEYVEVTNFDDTAVEMNGWRLTDASDGEPTFRFPPFELGAGASARVYTNDPSADGNGTFSFGSGVAIWNNREVDRAALRDPAGTVVSERLAKFGLWGAALVD